MMASSVYTGLKQRRSEEKNRSGCICFSFDEVELIFITLEGNH